MGLEAVLVVFVVEWFVDWLVFFEWVVLVECVVVEWLVLVVECLLVDVRDYFEPTFLNSLCESKQMYTLL